LERNAALRVTDTVPQKSQNPLAAATRERVLFILPPAARVFLFDGTFERP
jgi:hypothetical protein